MAGETRLEAAKVADGRELGEQRRRTKEVMTVSCSLSLLEPESCRERWWARLRSEGQLGRETGVPWRVSLDEGGGAAMLVCEIFFLRSSPRARRLVAVRWSGSTLIRTGSEDCMGMGRGWPGYACDGRGEGSKPSHKTSTSRSIHDGRRGARRDDGGNGEGEQDRCLQVLNSMRPSMQERKEKTLQSTE